ncbi:MAG: ankyrin repeat domain-containing protein [Deltaproteobacteria bacterium]|nr:ankyrin repeat domain-containing protein [Deltaproteobacteria bacterium]
MRADLSKHPRALACACEQKHGELVDLLLDRGADPSAALHDVATSNEHFLRVLLDRGADPNVRDASDETPLSRVVQRGLHRAARLLIDRGADLHVITSSGESLYAAAKRTYDGGLSDGRLVRQLLKEKGVGPLAAAPAAVEPPTPSAPRVGARVTHTKFGGGVVTKVDGGALDVTFDDGAKKTLLARFVKLDA